MGLRERTYALTEQGVAMLSSVLNSERAIQVDIQIIRIYATMCKLLLTHKDILLKFEQPERRTDFHDEKIALIFEYIKQLVGEKTEPIKRMGYKLSGEK